MNNTDRKYTDTFNWIDRLFIAMFLVWILTAIGKVEANQQTIIKGQKEQLKATDDLAKVLKLIAEKAFNGPSKAVLPLALREK